MKSALDVHRELLARGVPHEMVRIRGTVALSADDLPRALDVDPLSCVAVRCYVTDHGLAAAVVPAGQVPEPTALLDALGARTLRAASAHEVNLATDCAAGLVSPVGLPADLPLVADAALSAREVLYCPVGEGGVALGIRTADLLAASGARSVALTPLPLPEHDRPSWSAGAQVLDLDEQAERRTRRRSRG